MIVPQLQGGIAEFDRCAPRAGGLILPDDLLPGAFKQAGAVERRHALLTTRPAHMAALIDYNEALRRQKPDWKVPDLDPASGGTEARALFLLEKPGPKTDRGTGSGFISVHNNDPTAKATYRFALVCNHLPLHWCLFANVIPWWDGTIKIGAGQHGLSTAAITELLVLLPELRAIVLVGVTAGKAWNKSGLPTPQGVRLWRSYHPGPQVRARYPARWALIPDHWPTRADLETEPAAPSGDGAAGP